MLAQPYSATLGKPLRVRTAARLIPAIEAVPMTRTDLPEGFPDLELAGPSDRVILGFISFSFYPFFCLNV
jgi:hypothetical protein